MKILLLNHRGVVTEQDVTRSAFAALFDELNVRDLRPIFSPFQVATILPRDGAIILNVGFLKCILTHHTAYFIIHRHAERVRTIVTRLRQKRSDNPQEAFVMLVLEGLFDAKLVQLKEEIAHITTKAHHTLERIRKNFSEVDLENLLSIKKHLSKIETRNKEILSAAEEVLDDEEDVTYMLALGHATHDAQEELESIFENFIEQLEDHAGNMFRLSEDIEDTEEYLHLKLNARRTTIIRADLLATLFTLILSFLAVIVGLYGVNIRNGFEDSVDAFYILTIALVLILGGGVLTIFIYLKKKRLI